MRNSLRKSLVALMMVAPLSLAACGSGGESAQESTSALTVTSTVPTSSTASSTEAESTTTETETKTESEQPSEPVATDAAPQIEDPFAGGQLEYAEAQPVEGGRPATPEQAAEIDGLVRGLYQTTTLHSFLRYVPDNACNAVIEANGGQAAMDLGGIPDMPLNQIPNFNSAAARVDSIDNIVVDGNHASATVTAVTNGQVDTQTQRFLFEDNRWKFCN